MGICYKVFLVKQKLFGISMEHFISVKVHLKPLCMKLDFFCITTCTLAEVQTLNAIFDGFVQHKSADTAAISRSIFLRGLSIVVGLLT